MAFPAAARGRATFALAVAAALASPNAGEAVANKSDVGFRIVGSGSCRTASEGGGTFDNVDAPNATDCERRCAEDTDCVAYEVTYDTGSATFNPDKVSACEIHKEAITTAEAGDRNECWAKEGTGRKRDYALIGTGYCLPASLDRFHVSGLVTGSFDAHYKCRTTCDAEESCVAYQLWKNGGKLGCKVYTDPITQVEPCENGRECWCWVAKPLAKPEPAGQSSSTDAKSGGTSKFW